MLDVICKVERGLPLKNIKFVLLEPYYIIHKLTTDEKFKKVGACISYIKGKMELLHLAASKKSFRSMVISKYK